MEVDVNPRIEAYRVVFKTGTGVKGTEHEEALLFGTGDVCLTSGGRPFIKQAQNTTMLSQ
jgi:hypothetical protein